MADEVELRIDEATAPPADGVALEWLDREQGVAVLRRGEVRELVAIHPQAGEWVVVLRGRRMECFLDGRLVQSAEVLPRRTLRVYASAARDEKTGDIILKVVNPGEDATEVAVQVDGVTRVAGEARATVLTGERNEVVNSFGQPARVAPVSETIPGIAPRFRHRFAPRSLTVLRIGGGEAPSRAP